MGFEQLAKLRDELAKQANAQRKQKQAGARDAAQPGAQGPKDAKAKDANPRHARPNKPAGKQGAQRAMNQTGNPQTGNPRGKDAARQAGRPADNRPAQKSNPVDPVVHTIGKLQKRFPLAFPKNPAPKVALKIGILEDLLGVAGELKLSEQEVRDAVSTWCRGSRYWASLQEGAPRVDLSGAETGKVTSADAAFARRRASGRPKTAKPAEGAEQAAKVEQPAADASQPQMEAGASDAAPSEAAPSSDATSPDAAPSADNLTGDNAQEVDPR